MNLLISKKLSPLLLKGDININKLIKQISHQISQSNEDPNEDNYDPSNRRNYQNRSSNKYVKRSLINQTEDQFDHYRGDYRDRHRDNYRDQHRDNNRDNYRVNNRDNYRDNNRDNYRDNNRDNYRDNNKFNHQTNRFNHQTNRFNHQNSRFNHPNDQNSRFDYLNDKFNQINNENSEQSNYDEQSNQIDKYVDRSKNSQRQQSQFKQTEYEKSTKPKFDYKRYKSLNHQLNETSNQPKQFNRQLDKYERFAKQFKHLNVKNEDNALNFGSLTGKKPWLESEYLEDDPDHMERMEVVTDKKPRNYYLFEIKKAIYEDKKLGVQRALELYREMRLDRKLVTHDFFKMLIKGCSLVGYVDKAFDLFEEYKQLNPPVINRSIVTSMFNCCANSPDKQLGLERAKEFYDLLRLDGYDFNLMNYNCLIRTFGLLGDLDTSFAFVDTIVENRFRLIVDTFNNLLTAVCSSPSNGLSLATNIIQSMRFLNIQPDIYTYNLLYRITRDCHFGTEEELNDQIKLFKYPAAITSEFLRNVLDQQRAHLKENYTKLLEQKLESDKKIEQKLNLTESNEQSNLSPAVYDEQKSTELMCLNFLGTSVSSVDNQLKIVEIDYESLKWPENRLKLIGGLEYLLRYMLKDKIKPDIKTVSLLTSIIPNNAEEEAKLLDYVDKMKIKMDTDFYNMLIRRANIRNERDVAKKYLSLMSSKSLSPNIQTYGVMAISCYTNEDINEFIDDMDKYGIRPNVVIMTQLIRNAIFKNNFGLVAYLINCLRKYGVKPNVKLAEYLVMADELGAKLLEKYEQEEPDSENTKKYSLNYLKLKKNTSDYLIENQKIIDENDVLEQFRTKELPRNEEYHKFKVMMTKVLNEKKRFMAEMNESNESQSSN